MKKAISLLTSMMVVSLVAANMAIPASAAGDVTLDIDDITLTLDELTQNETVEVDGTVYYAVDLDILYTDTTGDGIGSFTLGFDTDNSTLALEPSNSSGTKFAFTGYSDNEEYVFNDLDSSLNGKRGTLLIFNAEVKDEDSPLWPSKLADGTTRKAFAVSVLVPAEEGTYTLNWDSTKIDDFFAADGNTAIIPILENGSVTVTAGGDTTTTTEAHDTTGTISIGNVTVEAGADGKVATDTVVQVPVSITGNPGVATIDLYHQLTIDPATSGAVATYVYDGDKLVLDAGDLTTDKDLEGVYSGKFPGKVMVVQNDAENITGDGVLYYVEITVPAGAEVDDVFNITFNEDSGYDFEMYNVDDINTTLYPALVNGTITVVSGPVTHDTTGTISIGDVEQDVTDIIDENDILLEDVVVQVPVSITDNPGVATIDLYHQLTIDPATSGAVATYVYDGDKLVLDAGDLTTDKDLEGVYSGKFPGKVMVVQNDAENITGDGVLYYVEITVPAGAEVDDVFNITFNEDSGYDFEMYNVDDINTTLYP
ncbi:MAG: hypothetical protein LUG94_00590, partial [Ruminococcus sp.]|nr:hypothetical protein [Ruminococcus sp.]